MNDEKHKMIQELLKEIFNNVNSWITHAEAKNAAIIAFNVAFLTFLWDMKCINEVKILFYLICIGMLASTIMAFISFFPKMGKEIKDQGGHSIHDNLIFYVDIARYDKTEYIKAIFKQYTQVDILDTEIQKIEEDFSAEITYNAAVAVRKHKWFNYAIKTEIVMLGILMIVMVIA